jgi:hypothetical protein
MNGSFGVALPNFGSGPRLCENVDIDFCSIRAPETVVDDL